MPLTDTAIRNAKPGEKPIRMFDDRGSIWRSPHRRQVVEAAIPVPRQGETYLVGRPYPDVTLKVARARRDEARKLLSDGIDPSADRKAKKVALAAAAAGSFEAVAEEWFTSFSPQWAPGHIRKIRTWLDKDLTPTLAFGRSARLPHPSCWRSRVASSPEGHYIPRTASLARRGKSSGMQLQPGGQLAIRQAIFAGHFRPPRGNISPQ